MFLTKKNTIFVAELIKKTVMNKQEVQQITVWQQAEEHYMIIDFLTKKEKLDREGTLFLARAYNEIEKYDQALELLDSIEDECQESAKWHYQKAYALFHKDNEHYIQAAALSGKAYELDPEDFDAKILMAQANKLEPMSERVERFWSWFAKNEKTLLDIASGETSLEHDELIEFINQGTSLISPNVYFNIGGGNEFTFCVEGSLYQFYLYPYIIAKAPEEIKSRWRFYPQKEEVKEPNFSFKMYGVDTDTNSLQIKPHYKEEENTFQIEYFVPNAEGIEDKKLDHLVYTFLELVIGEGVSYNYVAGIQRGEQSKDMIPLAELAEHIRATLKEKGKEYHTNPAKLYTVYRRNLEEQEENEDFVPRTDIFTGNTSFIELCSDYYQEEDFLYCGINSFGADAAFLCFYLSEGLEGQTILDLRYELEDKINETLEKQGLGYVFGSAMSEDIIYIDLMLYNFRDFLIENFNNQEDMLNNIFPEVYKENAQVQEILDNCSIFYSSFDNGVPMAQLFPDPEEEFEEDGQVHPELQGALGEVAEEMFGGMDMSAMTGEFDVAAMQNLAQQMLGQVDLESLGQEVREKGELDDSSLEEAYKEATKKMLEKLNQDSELD